MKCQRELTQRQRRLTHRQRLTRYALGYSAIVDTNRLAAKQLRAAT
ncbi:hypothetical protein RMSM_00096 [Rhodopirellula maiorica SM1]|uniref:Uncharacterized protein n=1 Tax=Rhodopirellula maiorica SM1 TaxID=1265738 RepID=M5RUW6_9BACT|nr:hypothetical protein RMSM_00096 [Rhodopirellula maiorica SM1]